MNIGICSCAKYPRTYTYYRVLKTASSTRNQFSTVWYTRLAAIIEQHNSLFKQQIRKYFAHGFHVGYSNSGKLLRSSNRNLKSASLHTEVIDKYLAKEVALNRVAGPFPIPPIHGLHISPFGVIPKRGQPGQWRLILDLSSPHGYSVNDGIPKDPYSLHYTSVDDAIRILLQLGPGGLMAKFDVESAYRNVPIHHEDRYLLGMSWRNQYYVDLTLA